MNSSVSCPSSDCAKESQIRDFWTLLKPRVMSLVVFTGWCGIFLAPGEIHPFIALIATCCIALGSGSAGAINMWLERFSDKKMKRTQNRPLPAGRMNPDTALEFGVLLSFASVFIMAFAVNYAAAFWLSVAILFYVFIYTLWLKPRTPQNIVIGGAAGAFPPMIGWAAVTGSVSLESVILFAIIFMWTPPHFWALSLYKSEDYARAGIPMLPVVSGISTTKHHILVYTILLVITSLLPSVIGMTQALYTASAVVLGALYLYSVLALYFRPLEAQARRSFGFSILYLFLLFTALIMDKVYYAT